jgi:peptidoglycan/LPS O-acetylase OafA/YrhL
VSSAGGTPGEERTDGVALDAADPRDELQPTAQGSAEFIDEGGTAPEDRVFRPDIEGLRAVSVLFVMLYHYDLLHLVGGFVGVDVFFVISGFVITGVLLRQHTSTGRPKMLQFYGRRVLRIVPMATVVIAAALIVDRIMFGAAVAHASSTGAWWAALFCANYHPILLLGPYWSLGVEEQFYLVYPALVLLIVTACSQWSLRAKLSAVLLVITIASYCWSALNPLTAYGSPFGRAWELALGALLAVATGYLKRLPAPLATAMTWCGLIGLTIIGFTLAFTQSYAGTTAILPVAAAALIIAGGTAVPRRGAETLLRLAPFKWIGRWSYSLYLWHFPLLYFVVAHWGHLKGGSGFLVAGGAVVLSAASYFGIENPIRHSAFLSRSPLVGIAFGVILIAACLGIVTIAAH